MDGEAGRRRPNAYDEAFGAGVRGQLERINAQQSTHHGDPRQLLLRKMPTSSTGARPGFDTFELPSISLDEDRTGVMVALEHQERRGWLVPLARRGQQNKEKVPLDYPDWMLTTTIWGSASERIAQPQRQFEQ